MALEYHVYESTIDENSGSEMERLSHKSYPTYEEAIKALNLPGARGDGIDCWDGKQWHYDVEGEINDNVKSRS